MCSILNVNYPSQYVIFIVFYTTIPIYLGLLTLQICQAFAKLLNNTTPLSECSQYFINTIGCPEFALIYRLQLTVSYCWNVFCITSIILHVYKQYNSPRSPLCNPKLMIDCTSNRTMNDNLSNIPYIRTHVPYQLYSHTRIYALVHMTAFGNYIRIFTNTCISMVFTPLPGGKT